MHLGAQELIIILLIAVVLFGGKKFSGLGKALGTSLREFKEEVNKPDGASKHDTLPPDNAGTRQTDKGKDAP